MHDYRASYWIPAVLVLIVISGCAILKSSNNNTIYLNLGAAQYAMMSSAWPCEAASKADKILPELRKAVLWNTFGTDTSCLIETFKNPKLKAIEIHLINEVCQRDNDCGSYEFLYGISESEYNQKLIDEDAELLASLQSYLQAPAALISENLQSGTTCYINPGLESNLTTEAAEVLIAQVSPLFPSCKIVWNPNDDNPDAAPIDGTVFEEHHTSNGLPSPCIADLDGEDISFPSRPAVLSEYVNSSDLDEIAERFANCDIDLFWVAEFNGLTGGSFVDPRERTADMFPNEELFLLVNRQILNPGS